MDLACFCGRPALLGNWASTVVLDGRSFSLSRPRTWRPREERNTSGAAASVSEGHPTGRRSWIISGFRGAFALRHQWLATCSSPRVEGVQQVQRRCPWARAMIASPYIRQLRYGLPLCCIHGQSRGKDGAHLHNGRLARPSLRWFSAATHPTRPTPTRRSVGTVSL